MQGHTAIWRREICSKTRFPDQTFIRISHHSHGAVCPHTLTILAMNGFTRYAATILQFYPLSAPNRHHHSVPTGPQNVLLLNRKTIPDSPRTAHNNQPNRRTNSNYTGQQNLTFFFGTRGKISNPNRTFNAEFKCVSSFSPTPTVCL